MVLRVQYAETVNQLNVAGEARAGAFLLQPERVLLRLLRAEHDLFHIEDDVRDVLDDVIDARELVKSALEANGRDGRPLQRGQEDAAKRIADRDPVAALERLAGELPVEFGETFGLHLNRLGADQIAPIA